MSIINEIYDTLSKGGKEVFYPGQHKGECTKEYIVVKNSGTVSLNVSSEFALYTIMLYVPKNEYSRLEDFSFEVKQMLKKMYPKTMYVGNETETYYDEIVKGHMKSFQYQNCRKIERFDWI